MVDLHKPFTTLDQQLEILQRRGLMLSDSTKFILMSEGYYSVINGYKDLFIDKHASDIEKDDRYQKNSSFDDIYALFTYDRELRMLLFGAITKAEALLKTVCSYQFSQAYPDVANPYRYACYYDEASSKSAEKLISQVFDKILGLNGRRAGRNVYDGKQYIKHCMECHDGQVPMWVLANDLSLGQIVWFFQIQKQDIQHSISNDMSEIYSKTHKHAKFISANKLDKIYSRLVFFRNICAHDERLYCARRDERSNESLFQTIKDLEYVIDKPQYLIFLQRYRSDTKRILQSLPNQSQRLLSSMGLKNLDELQEHMEHACKS